MKEDGPDQAFGYTVNVMKLGDEDDLMDVRDLCLDDKELDWHRGLDMEGVHTLAFEFASAYKNTRATFIDPNSPVADLVRDFI